MLNDISFTFVVQFNYAPFKKNIYVMDILKILCNGYVKKKYFINTNLRLRANLKIIIIANVVKLTDFATHLKYFSLKKTNVRTEQAWL